MPHTLRLLAFAGLLALAAPVASAQEMHSLAGASTTEPALLPALEAKTRMSSFGQPGHLKVVRAEAHPISRIELFAGSRGFVVGRTGAIYDLEGGATLHVLAQLSVTGSYRMIGYDLAATGTSNLSPQISGPFVALNLEF